MPRRRRRELGEPRSKHQRDYVQGNMEDYRWDAAKEARFAGEHLTRDEPLPEYIQQQVEQWQREGKRMARNHRFYLGRFVEQNPEAPRLFRKFFEYAQERWGSDEVETYAKYCRRRRNRPEGSAVWDELKTIMRRWDEDVNGNRNRMASINKVDFCSLIW